MQCSFLSYNTYFKYTFNMTALVPWDDGNGNIVIEYLENNQVKVSSDTLSTTAFRTQNIVFETLDGKARALLEVIQTSDNKLILRDINGLVLQDSKTYILTAIA